MFDYILILLLAHLLTDFVFQTEKMDSRKHGNDNIVKHKAILLHSAYFLLTSVGFVLLYWWIFEVKLSWVFLGLITFLAASHYLIDLLKVQITCKRFSKTDTGKPESNCPLWLLLLDQAIHILLIIIVSYFAFAKLWFPLLPVGAFVNINSWFPLLSLTTIQKAIIILCLMIFISKFTNVIIQKILKLTKMEAVDNEKEIKIGRYIGTTERILTVIAIIANTYEAVAILFASKTAIRFGQMDKSQEYRDYYILGTLLSALFGIIIGILIKIILLSNHSVKI